MLRPFRLRVVSLALLAGCTTDPVVDMTPMMFDGAPQAGFADTLIGFTEANATVMCAPAPLSDCTAEPLVGQCTSDAAVNTLGMPDGVTFPLDAGGRVEVAFRCGWIMRHYDPARPGTILPDLRIVAVGAAGLPDGGLSTAVVEVSYDGSTYVELGPVEPGETRLSLSRVDFQIARFVRIADVSGGGVEIDAVEACGDGGC